MYNVKETHTHTSVRVTAAKPIPNSQPMGIPSYGKFYVSNIRRKESIRAPYPEQHFQFSNMFSIVFIDFLFGRRFCFLRYSGEGRAGPGRAKAQGFCYEYSRRKLRVLVKVAAVGVSLFSVRAGCLVPARIATSAQLFCCVWLFTLSQRHISSFLLFGARTGIL